MPACRHSSVLMPSVVRPISLPTAPAAAATRATAPRATSVPARMLTKEVVGMPAAFTRCRRSLAVCTVAMRLRVPATPSGETRTVHRMSGCELCEAARFTAWHHEDDVCWVADCESCDLPMVVWKRHGTEPPAAEHEHMLATLG